MEKMKEKRSYNILLLNSKCLEKWLKRNTMLLYNVKKLSYS